MNAKSVHENFLWLRNHFEKNAERIFQCAKYLKISYDRVLRFGFRFRFRFGSYRIGSVLRWLHFVGPHPIQRMDCEIVCKQISSNLYIYSRTCTNQKITYTRLCHVCDMHYPGWSWQGLYAGAAKIVSEKLWTFSNGDHWANARFSYRRNQKNVY